MTLTIVAAVGSGVMAGVFFAFSTFVMKGLAALPDETGMAAMQSINVAAPSPRFMLPLFGVALLCLALGVVALFRLGESYSIYLLVGSALYLVAIVLTGTYHVPRNNALASIDPVRPEAAAHWRRYFAEWTRWNHVRTVGPMAAAVVFTVALVVG
ncbi:MAG: DUF1772 domain-containing protein [Acidimicrobiales bacterium]